MFDGIGSNPMVAKLQAAVAFTARRHELIANNIANIATPGYRAQDLSEKDFVKALADATVRPDKAFKVIDSPDAGAVRPDGNNVSIEREMSRLSKNVIRHNVLIAMLDRQIRSIESALRERVT
ncbi:MAG TPA: flagellar basal body rod protein FlgB [Planctomycetota bacterium]|nr:flagellar basal body rod protein FlgB [Planctomycetota bacterium]